MSASSLSLDNVIQLGRLAGSLQILTLKLLRLELSTLLRKQDLTRCLIDDCHELGCQFFKSLCIATILNGCVRRRKGQHITKLIEVQALRVQRQ